MTYEFDCVHCGKNVSGDFWPTRCPNCGEQLGHHIGSTKPYKFVPAKGKKWPNGETWAWCSTKGCQARVRVKDFWRLGRSREESEVAWKYGKRFNIGKGKGRVKQGSRGKKR